MNNAQFLRTGLVLLALPAILTACSSSTGTAVQAEPLTETTTAATTAPALPSPPPADGGSFLSVYELQEAYILAGGECEAGQLIPINGAITGYNLECDRDTILNVYPDESGVAEMKERFRQVNANFNIETTTQQLQGVNWVIQDDDEFETTLQEQLGGQLVEF